MEKEKILKNAVLGFLIKDGKVCLALKKKQIGAGLLNGYGGGFKKGEAPIQAIFREIREEAEVIAWENCLEKVAEIDFHNITETGVEFICKVHVHFSKRWAGTPVETKEMGPPEWYKFNEIPFERIMPADRHWLPLILPSPSGIVGKSIVGSCSYGPRQKELISPFIWRSVAGFSS